MNTSGKAVACLALMFSVVTVFVLGSQSIVVAQIRLDVTSSVIMPENLDTFAIHNLQAPDIPGIYWVRFKWDPNDLVFYPIDAGVESITEPSVDVKGVYRLKGFLVKYSNGLTMDDQTVAASGTMRVGPSNMSQTVSLLGQTMSMSGTYAVNYRLPGGGTVSVSDQSGTHTLAYWTPPHEMTIYAGLLKVSSTLSFEEWDRWEKIDNNPSAPASVTDPPDNQVTGFRWIGEILYESGAVDK